MLYFIRLANRWLENSLSSFRDAFHLLLMKVVKEQKHFIEVDKQWFSVIDILLIDLFDDIVPHYYIHFYFNTKYYYFLHVNTIRYNSRYD